LDESIRKLLPVYVLVFLRAFGLSISINGPMMPLFVRSLGVSVSQWGLLSTFSAVGLICFEAFWGFMSDRVNRIRILIIAMIFMGAVLPMYTFEGLLPYFFVFQFLMGSFMVMVGPTTRAIIADHSPVNRVGFNVSLWSTCVSMGGILGPVIGGYISQSQGYTILFYVSSTILLAAALLMFFTGRNLVISEKGKKKIDLKENLRSIFFDSQVKLTFILAFLIFLGMSAFRSFLPIYASELVSMDEVSIGLMMTISTAMQLITTPIIGAGTDKYRIKKILIILLGMTGALFFLVRFAVTPVYLTLIAIGLTISFSSQAVSLILVSKLASRERLGITIGVYGTFEDLGLMVGPLVFGYVWEAYNPSYIYLVSAGAAFLALVLISGTKLSLQQ